MGDFGIRREDIPSNPIPRTERISKWLHDVRLSSSSRDAEDKDTTSLHNNNNENNNSTSGYATESAREIPDDDSDDSVENPADDSVSVVINRTRERKFLNCSEREKFEGKGLSLNSPPNASRNLPGFHEILKVVVTNPWKKALGFDAVYILPKRKSKFLRSFFLHLEYTFPFGVRKSTLSALASDPDSYFFSDNDFKYRLDDYYPDFSKLLNLILCCKQ